MGNKLPQDLFKQTLNRLSNHEIHSRTHPVLGSLDILYSRKDYSAPALMRKTITCPNIDDYCKKVEPLSKSKLYLMLPTQVQISTVEQLCGSLSFGSIYYPHFPVTLADEIKTRAKKDISFQEYQLWIIVGSLLGAFFQSLQSHEELSPPLFITEHILANQKGQLRVVNSLTFPDLIQPCSEEESIDSLLELLNELKENCLRIKNDFLEMMSMLEKNPTSTTICNYFRLIQPQMGTILERKGCQLNGIDHQIMADSAINFSKMNRKRNMRLQLPSNIELSNCSISKFNSSKKMEQGKYKNSIMDHIQQKLYKQLQISKSSSHSKDQWISLCQEDQSPPLQSKKEVVLSPFTSHQTSFNSQKRSKLLHKMDQLELYLDQQIKASQLEQYL